MSKVFIEESTLTAIGDAIRSKEGSTALIAPLDMADKITNLPSGGGDLPEVEPIVLSEDCKYGCSGAIPSSYINLFGDTVSTNGVTDTQRMFLYYQNETIPFEINIDNSTSRDMGYMFNYCKNLKELPAINNAYPSQLTQIFQHCWRLREIPEDYFDNWNFSRMQSYAYSGFGSCFSSCYSLRKIPKSFLKNCWGIQTSNNYSPYYSLIYHCFVLDELKELAIHQGNLTSNTFALTFTNCYRLKDFTFEVNEDGTAKTAKWKSQTIDLSGCIGHASTLLADKWSMTTYYNSGITVDKEVTDDTTYAALKDDPDWFTRDASYSRYNHDSAVNTINSLPDCSATGTNTIKFKGVAGAKTDGGAINTLTEEEIAVATTKGWTVTFA